MNKYIDVILSKVLSEELGRQEHWDQNDKKYNHKYPEGFDRQAIINDIKEFMTENNIKFRSDYFSDGYNSI